jgi:hypothetical protein
MGCFVMTFDDFKWWWAGAALLCVSSAAFADTGADKGGTDQSIPKVEVQGTTQDRDEKSYRDMLAAMDVFQKNHGLAPTASLRFKVFPRHEGVSMDGLALQIAGDHTSIPVPLAPDHTFTLPRNAEAANDDAKVRFNRKEGSLAWRADIRSQGVPPNARRLGDLLLECKVAMAGDLVAYVHHPINMMITKMEDPCRTLSINMYYFADRPLFSVTLVAGNRRSILPAAMLHGPTAPMMPGHEDWTFLRERVYTVKFKTLYDQGWPDDTLLQFDYMDDDTPAGSRP